MKEVIAIHILSEIFFTNSLYMNNLTDNFTKGGDIALETQKLTKPARRILLITFLVMGLASASMTSRGEGGLEALVSSEEAVRILGGFRFTEGPVDIGDGRLLFSDIPTSTTFQWHTGTSTLTRFRENTGGGNGLRVDKNGIVYTCEGSNRRISARFPDGEVVTVVDSYEGKPLNSPNDLWIDRDGGIYFTDPRYGNMDDLQQGGFHVYYKFPASSRVIRVCGDLVKPNGIIGTPDGKTLYVADLGDNRIWRYSISPDRTLSAKTLFAERGSDGMTMDEKGNVYLTQGAVHVYAPDSTYLGAIRTAEPPANVTFGGDDGKTLFITARTSVYALKMSVKGQ